MAQPHPRDWSAFACPNPRCSAFGQRGQDNLRPHGWSSKAHGIRCLRCTVCGMSFSERAGTALFRSRLPQDKAVQIAQHLAEGNGMRSTSRLCGVSLNTVLRFALRAAPAPQWPVRHISPCSSGIFEGDGLLGWPCYGDGLNALQGEARSDSTIFSRVLDGVRVARSNVRN